MVFDIIALWTGRLIWIGLGWIVILSLFTLPIWLLFNGFYRYSIAFRRAMYEYCNYKNNIITTYDGRKFEVKELRGKNEH